MEFLKTFLGGAGAAALVTGLFALVQWQLNRNAQQQDRAMTQQGTTCAAQRKEIDELKVMVTALVTADRTILYDRIKYLAKSYIKRGWITVEEYEDLKRMHGVYHTDLKGNGFLDAVMGEVDQLEKRVL